MRKLWTICCFTGSRVFFFFFVFFYSFSLVFFFFFFFFKDSHAGQGHRHVKFYLDNQNCIKTPHFAWSGSVNIILLSLEEDVNFMQKVKTPIRRLFCATFCSAFPYFYGTLDIG